MSRMFDARERDNAFIAAVVKDDWEPVRAYTDKYHVRIPEKEIVFKGGVYKAVRECNNIPDDVKKLAAEKCIALGMSPSMFGEVERK